MVSRVGGVLAGFVTIGAIIAIGALLAQLKVVDESAQVIFSRLAFFVANPALMITVLGGTDVSQLFSANLVASVSSVVVVSTPYSSRPGWCSNATPSDTVIGTFSSRLRQRRQPGPADRGLRRWATCR